MAPSRKRLSRLSSVLRPVDRGRKIKRPPSPSASIIIFNRRLIARTSSSSSWTISGSWSSSRALWASHSRSRRSAKKVYTWVFAPSSRPCRAGSSSFSFEWLWEPSFPWVYSSFCTFWTTPLHNKKKKNRTEETSEQGFNRRVELMMQSFIHASAAQQLRVLTFCLDTWR